MTALTALTAEKSRARAASLALAQAESAQAAATAKAASAARAASIGMGLLRGAMSLLGGPAGIVMIAASALIYWWQSAKQAKEEAINYADSLDGVIAKMKEMNQVQLTGTLADVAKSVAAQKDHIDDLNDSVRDAQTEYDKYSGLAKQFGVEQDKNNGYVKKANEWLQTLNQRKRDVSDATDKLNRTTEQQSLIQEQLNQKARESEEAFNILANNLRNKIRERVKLLYLRWHLLFRCWTRSTKKLQALGKISQRNLKSHRKPKS
ncbi:phage tail tape measure protein [Enterobacter asburiae]|uniref:phage tail tape measure protein n=1 Tax=Enterobacter asburiae TaxID=61645 RepID=UPI003C12F854